MNFPYTRHYQRYEYVVEKGWVDGKTVVDIGCGNAIGSYILASKALVVVAVDPCLVGKVNKPFVYLGNGDGSTLKNVIFIPKEFGDMSRMDVGIMIEVVEHLKEPGPFLNRVAHTCTNLFITTPVVKETGKTSNPQHVVEYSAKDFDELVGREFEILEKKYQTAGMGIVDSVECGGDSMDRGHVVQMVWGRSRYA